MAAVAVRPLLLLAIVMASVASVANNAAASYSVFVAPARSSLVSGDITAICGPSTLGCTDITDVALQAHCERRGEEWATNASIVFAPVMHLPASAGPAETHRLVEHELEHLRDFRHFAEGYARSLSRRRFDSAAACRALAL